MATERLQAAQTLLTDRPKKWTYEEALQLVQRNPYDSSMQYIALQLARRAKKLSEMGSLLSNFHIARRRASRTSDATNLFGIFSGALAVQESLQYDAMVAPDQFDQRSSARTPEIDNVSVQSLQSHTIPSHPWKEMLGDDVKPACSRVSHCVPPHFFLVESKSALSIMEALSASGMWRTLIAQQAYKDGRHTRCSEKYLQQLGIIGESRELLFDKARDRIQEVGITGSDLYLLEGSDLTVLIYSDSTLADSLLDHAGSGYHAKDNQVEKIDLHNMQVIHVYSAESEVNAYSVNPYEGLHIRSNSLEALSAVLQVIQSEKSMAAEDEFKYVRKLMPLATEHSPVFIYLSDPFVRSLTGPQLRIAQRRRKICHNHLKMIENASLLFISEFGRPPENFEELVYTNCAPREFNTGDLICPCGGLYGYKKSSRSSVNATCTVHGTTSFLTPCIEIPLAYVTRSEANVYTEFLNEYNSYWRTYFDPIAISIDIHDDCYRAETIVLPLIDNSIYSQLAATMKGLQPELMNEVVPQKNIFTVVSKFNLDAAGALSPHAMLGRFVWGTSAEFKAALNELLDGGLKNQFAIHVYDGDPTFGLDIVNLFGFVVGQSNILRGGGLPVIAAGLVASLNAPVYASLKISNPEATDRFLKELALALSCHPRQRSVVQTTYSALLLNNEELCHSVVIMLGPLKLRLYWLRIKDTIYIATKRNIIEDLLVEAAAESDLREDPVHNPCLQSHAMLELRPERWNEVCQDVLSGWRENERIACHGNLVSLTVSARALHAVSNKQNSGAVSSGDLMDLLHRNTETSRLCPDSGIYRYDPLSCEVSCSVHGTLSEPRQPTEATVPVLKQHLSSATAGLRFLEDGLHANIMLRRSKH